MNKHPRTIDALIKWVERCLFHDDKYTPPNERDLHVWLKHAKKFKREQNNLKTKLNRFQVALERIKNGDPMPKTIAEIVLEGGDYGEEKTGTTEDC